MSRQLRSARVREGACVLFETDRAGNCAANRGTWHSTAANEGSCTYPESPSSDGEPTPYDAGRSRREAGADAED